MPFDFNPQDVMKHERNAMEHVEKQAQGNLSSQIFEEMKSLPKSFVQKSETLPESLDLDASSLYGEVHGVQGAKVVELPKLPKPPKYGVAKSDHTDDEGNRTYHESIALPGYRYRENNQINSDGTFTNDLNERRGIDYSKIHEEKTADGTYKQDASDKTLLGLMRTEIHEEEHADGTYNKRRDFVDLGIWHKTRSSKDAEGNANESVYDGTAFDLISNFKRDQEFADGSSVHTKRKRFLGNEVKSVEEKDTEGHTTTTNSYSAPFGLFTVSNDNDSAA